MSILIKLKDTRIGFICNEYINWKEIENNCPLVEKIFYQSGYDIAIKYYVKYKDPRLRELMSQVHKFKNTLKFKEDVIYSLSDAITKILHQSMSKKKDLEVKCLWK